MRAFPNRTLAGLALALLLAALPAVAGEIIPRGVDLWQTAGAGATFTNFADDPIPADFFCPGSPPFTGTIALEGVPLATRPAGGLGEVDTLVERIDTAVFDPGGVTKTRIRLLALSLAGAEPVETGCGLYHVAVSLDGEQPITLMEIQRTRDNGGTYQAPLALDVKVVFTPLSGDLAQQRQLRRHIELGPGTNSVWSFAQDARFRAGLQVDTDGDQVADTPLPAPTEFVAGYALAAEGGFLPAVPNCQLPYCPYQSCHCNPNSNDPYEDGSGCSASHLHCVWTCTSFCPIAM